MPQSDIEQLRQALAHRLREKAELEQQVRALQSRLDAEVAPLQEEVLRLQMEWLKAKAQAQMRSARLRNAYHDAQDEYETFRDGRPQTPPNDAAAADLKSTYRQATKRCHPDTVSEAYRDEAEATFRALESAYNANHPDAVQAIAEALENWGFPPAPSAPMANTTRDPDALRQAVAALDDSIDRLQSSEAYRAATQPGNVDVEAVVGAQKQALKERLRALKRRRHARP